MVLPQVITRRSPSYGGFVELIALSALRDPAAARYTIGAPSDSRGEAIAIAVLNTTVYQHVLHTTMYQHYGLLNQEVTAPCRCTLKFFHHVSYT